MNAIKTCIFLGKNWLSMVCPCLVQAVKEKVKVSDANIISRFVEIFDTFVITLKTGDSISSWTREFSLLCLEYVSGDNFEAKCTIINYFINILNYDSESFFCNQKTIWAKFKLSGKVFKECDMEAEGKNNYYESHKFTLILIFSFF